MSLAEEPEVQAASGAELARMRAVGCLHGLVLAVAFARHLDQPLEALVAFGLGGFEGGGYYDDWVAEHGSGAAALDAFVRDFVRGRAMIYDRTEVRLVDGVYHVASPLWFWRETPEFFFYYGITPEEFAEYTRLLAIENARRLGVALQLTYDGDHELAQISRGTVQ